MKKGICIHSLSVFPRGSTFYIISDDFAVCRFEVGCCIY